MSSALESEVYAERQRLPGVGISVPKLMRELMLSASYPESGGADMREVSLTVAYRRDVETSQWWTLKWNRLRDDGAYDRMSAEATTLELCLFRAAVLARRDDERAKRQRHRACGGQNSTGEGDR